MNQEKKININGQLVPGIEVQIKSAEEKWNRLNLEDGTVMSYRTIAMQVYRAPQEYSDAQGNPVYSVDFQAILRIDRRQ